MTPTVSSNLCSLPMKVQVHRYLRSGGIYFQLCRTVARQALFLVVEDAGHGRSTVTTGG